MEDGNPTFSNDKMVNYGFKCLNIYNTIKKSLKFQKDNYEFDFEENYLAQIHFGLHSTPDIDFYDISLKIEQIDDNDNLSLESCLDFPSITYDVAIQQISNFRDVEILQQFDPNFISKKSTALSSANDYLQVKTDRLLHLIPRKKSPRGTSISLLSNSLLTPDSDPKEIIAYMKSSDTGIKTHIQIDIKSRTNIEYFSPRELVSWLEKYLGDKYSFHAHDVAQILIDSEYIVCVDSGKVFVEWRNNPFIKLTFGEKAIANSSLMAPNSLSNSFERMYSSEDLKKTKDNEETINIEEISRKMKHPQSGLKIKNRKWMLKKFPNCFVAEQAVTWISYHLDIPNREEATKIGLKMQEKNIIEHVTKDHPFQDKYLFFKFI